MTKIINYFFFYFYFQVSSLQDAPGGIFKLPDLVVVSNSSYLVRQRETLLECRIVGHYPELENMTIAAISWSKDGAPVTTESQKMGLITDKEYDMRLRIVHANLEGYYQCSGTFVNLRLSDELDDVEARLVSAPMFLRRARISKFERFPTKIIRVRQGQTARMPCLGLPDVIPSPPEIWFEKEGNEGIPLGRTGNERFISTTSALQIALTQPSDAGRYFCFVRNSFTGQVRKAPRPIYLVVEPIAEQILDRENDEEQLHSNRRGIVFTEDDTSATRIIFPEVSKESPEPIEFNVVSGQIALLECIISEARIMWNKPDNSMPPISLTDDRARIRQIWGNLRIKNVTASDSGEYICHGFSKLGFIDPRFYSHFKVTYRLIVHSPTSVRLMLAQQQSDKSWQLSCYAHNHRYEIPMVYINGLPLKDAMEAMGIEPVTNIYTNPINVTLKASKKFSGSVQCISRPAMEEAEIYGNGLERGRSMNLYVDARMNDLALVESMFDDRELAQIASLLSDLSEKDNSTVEPIRENKTEFVNDREGRSMEKISAKIESEPAKEAKEVKGTISQLKKNRIKNEEKIPEPPMISRLQTVSHESVLLGWSYTNKTSSPQTPLYFVVNYKAKSDEENAHSVEVNASSKEILLIGLKPDTEYEVSVMAGNYAGRSSPSQIRIIRTYYGPVTEQLDKEGDIWKRVQYDLMLETGLKFLIALMSLLIAITLVLALICLILFRIHDWRRQQGSRSSLESSERTYMGGAHRVRRRCKKHIYHEPTFMANDPICDLSPLGDRDFFIDNNYVNDRPDMGSSSTPPHQYGNIIMDMEQFGTRSTASASTIIRPNEVNRIHPMGQQNQQTKIES